MAWCKERAHREYEYYREHEPSAAIRNAVASMASDLGKHPETEKLVSLAVMLGMAIRDEQSLGRFIDGFN